MTRFNILRVFVVVVVVLTMVSNRSIFTKLETKNYFQKVENMLTPQKNLSGI